MSGKLRFFLLSVLVFLIFFFLYKIYFSRLNAFGCFDDCFNIMAGYFLIKGKALYSQIFFNHQPLMVVISYLIQSVFQPVNIYELILRHRQVIFIYSFLFNLLIVWRFSLIGLGFIFIYEFSKFYLFGDRFLAEGIIIYPLVYVTGLVFYKRQQKKLFSFEYFLSAILIWFVIFMREPYIPLAILIYFFIIYGRRDYRPKVFSVAVLLILIISSLSRIPLKDYFFDVITVNQTYTNKVLSKEIFLSFFYPLYLFLGGEWNIFRHFLIVLDLVFLSSFFLLLRFPKERVLLVTVFILLGLANLRPLPAGSVFYAAYHLIVWYGLFVFSLLFLTLELKDRYRQKNGHFLEVGEAIRVLSDPNDTLFLDGHVDLIYWQANKVSPYKYSWFVPAMGGWPKFMQAREEMFIRTPPDFYYSHETLNFSDLPPEIKDDYQQFYSQGKPTKLFIRKAKIPQISKDKWKKAKEWSYELR